MCPVERESGGKWLWHLWEPMREHISGASLHAPVRAPGARVAFSGRRWHPKLAAAAKSHTSILAFGNPVSTWKSESPRTGIHRSRSSWARARRTVPVAWSSDEFVSATPTPSCNPPRDGSLLSYAKAQALTPHIGSYPAGWQAARRDAGNCLRNFAVSDH